MNDLEKILQELHLENNIKPDDIPTIDLYMDQVIQLFEGTFHNTKRNDEEKILTKTMINNYAKGKLFFPIKNKKYSKEHILLISLIYQLKPILSINDIKTVLEGINHKIVTDEEFDFDLFYNHYLHLIEKNAEQFTNDVKRKQEDVNEEISQITEGDEDYLKKALLVASFVNMSNLYRRVAEKLVDEIARESETS